MIWDDTGDERGKNTCGIGSQNNDVKEEGDDNDGNRKKNIKI